MSNFIPRYIIKKIESRGLNTFFYTHVHCSIFTTAKGWMEVIQMFMNGRKGKQNVVCTHNGILSNLKRKGGSDTHYPRTEHQRLNGAK